MKILGGHYNDNDQLGIGGNTATGIVVDGLDDNPATLDGPELARNHTRRASCDFEGGGMNGMSARSRSAMPTCTTTTAGACGLTSTPRTC
jgi:hypothetical protein